jgi:hypothetical protein
MYAKFCVNRETANNFMRLFVNRRAHAIEAERPLPNGSVYEAEPTPEAQLAYLDGLKKLAALPRHAPDAANFSRLATQVYRQMPVGDKFGVRLAAA